MSFTEDYNGQDVIDICSSYMNETHIDYIKKALDVATRYHEGQYRLSGEPFIMHPIQVAGMLADLQMDPDTVATGFLHDVVEDTEYTLEELEADFSKTVAFLVDGVTKLGRLKYQSKEEALAENHRKMLLAMAQDMRIVIVKIADRLHNMRTLNHQRKEKQVEISRESLEIYAPLADRLGMIRMKWELEDLSLRYMNPSEYYRIVELMDSKRKEREDYIVETIALIQEGARELGIEAEVSGRPKHIYSIYRKMVDQDKEFNEIYDLLAVRAIVDREQDCYAILGTIHGRWKPLPGRFKDYIAMPKTNMYQSIHTTVIGPKGKPVEIQIRTHEMHQVAEFGVAAHWAYKEGITENVQGSNPIQEQMEWFRDLLDLQDEARDASEFMSFVKEDIFKDQVYVFTPTGDVIELSRGSGPIDFAYHIHTEIGEKTVGAKVNNKIVPLNYKLQNGDIVEVLTNASSKGPSQDWLNYTATSKARNRIRHYFKMRDRDLKTDEGQDKIEKLLRERHIPVRELSRNRVEEALLGRFNFKTMEELFARVGLSELSALAVVRYIEEVTGLGKEDEDEFKDSNVRQISAPKRKARKGSENGVIVEGIDSMMIRLSRCCNPVPGDDIIGYITRGRGVSVHRADCENLQNESDVLNRTIPVQWEFSVPEGKAYETEIRVIGFDRPGLINDLLGIVSTEANNLQNVNANVTQDGYAKVIFKIGISNIHQLQELMQKLRDVPDVYSVRRVTQ